MITDQYNVSSLLRRSFGIIPYDGTLRHEDFAMTVLYYPFTWSMRDTLFSHHNTHTHAHHVTMFPEYRIKHGVSVVANQI